MDGRAGGIRTRDLFVPNEARYQTALQPEWKIVNDDDSVALGRNQKLVMARKTAISMI